MATVNMKMALSAGTLANPVVSLGHWGRARKMEGVVRWKHDVEWILQSSQHREPTDVFMDLWALGAAMSDEAAHELIASNPIFLEYRPQLKSLFYKMVTKSEKEQAENILDQLDTSSNSFIEVANSITMLTYKRSEDMFDNIDFRGCRCMVLVGSGWLPSTLFLVHEKTNVPELVGIDLVSDAVHTSNEVAKRLRYSRVKAVLQDGCLYDYGQAEVVYVVGMVSSKSGILSRIADTAPSNVQIIVNEPYSLGHLFEESAESALDPRLEIIGRGKRGFTLRRDLYLTRRAKTYS